jgi:hypothetical protein
MRDGSIVMCETCMQYGLTRKWQRTSGKLANEGFAQYGMRPCNNQPSSLRCVPCAPPVRKPTSTCAG